MALIGNLVSSGAGSNELRDSMSAGSLARMATSAGSKAFGLATGVAFRNPLAKIAGSVVGDALSMKSRDWGSRLLDDIGLGVGDSSSRGGGEKSSGGGSGSKNDKKANYGSNPNAAKDAIQNQGFQPSNWDSKDKENGNSNQPKNNNNNMVNDAIQNKKDDKNKNNQNSQKVK